MRTQETGPFRKPGDTSDTNLHKMHLIIILKYEKIHLNRKRMLREAR